MAPPTKPQPSDLSIFNDEQLMVMLNIAGQARLIARDELARRHPLVTDIDQS
jgi:hypothetical protein